MPEPLRYFFDEHMPAAIAEQLKAHGIDVLTTAEAGRANLRISDEEQLAYSTHLGRVLVTEDHHFVALSRARQPHAGVVYFPIKLDIGACIEYLERLAFTTEPAEMRDMLIYGKW